MARVFPKAYANKRRGAILAEFVHLYIGDPLHACRAEGQAQEQHACDISRKSFTDSVNTGQNTAVHHQCRHHMDAHKIDDGVKYTRLFMKHGVTPVLVREIPKGVRPVRRQSDCPKGHDHKQKNSEERQLPADGKRHENDGRLHAPIGVVDRCVPKDEAENKDCPGCLPICDEKRQPPIQRERAIGKHAHHGGNYVDQRDNNKTHRTVLL